MRKSFRSQQDAAIFCRANSTDITKDLCEVLLGLEATGYGHVQYARIGSMQQGFGTFDPLAQDELMRGLSG